MSSEKAVQPKIYLFVCRSEYIFDVIFERQGVLGGPISRHGNALRIAQKLGEVPLEGTVGGEEEVQRVRHALLRAAVDLAQNWKGGALVFGKRINFIIGAGLLRPEAVAGEAKDLQTIRAVGRVETLQLGIVLVR
jgi:hypothetical protein